MELPNVLKAADEKIARLESELLASRSSLEYERSLVRKYKALNDDLLEAVAEYKKLFPTVPEYDVHRSFNIDYPYAGVFGVQVVPKKLAYTFALPLDVQTYARNPLSLQDKFKEAFHVIMKKWHEDMEDQLRKALGLK